MKQDNNRTTLAWVIIIAILIIGGTFLAGKP